MVSVKVLLPIANVSTKLKRPTANQNRRPQGLRHAWAGVRLEMV